MSEYDCDVVVVGAGLAGLRCASDLTATGLHVAVLEAGDEVGGRVRTDAVDGFLVDRGFQLLNPAYPAVRAGIDVDALALQQFAGGVAARTEDALARLGHPLHAPGLLPASAITLAPRWREVAALARWVRPLAPVPGRSLAVHLEELERSGRLGPTLAESMDAAGLHGVLRRVMDRFLAGVLLDDSGTTSAAFALLLVNSFLRGTPGLPADGMRALPRQLATSAGQVHLSTTVHAIVREGRGVTVRTDRGTWRAPGVVVATDPESATGFIGTPSPLVRGVQTAWFAAGPEVPQSRLLHVDARSRPGGPVVNTAVVSAAAPTYAPAGRHLVEASALLPATGAAPALADVRRHAGEILGCDPSGWETIAVHRVPHALPAQAPPLTARRPIRLRRGWYVCGDHRDTASIQGALVSGRRTARQLVADLRIHALV